MSKWIHERAVILSINHSAVACDVRSMYSLARPRALLCVCMCADEKQCLSLSLAARAWQWRWRRCVCEGRILLSLFKHEYRRAPTANVTGTGDRDVCCED